ncbi:MAG: acetylglutamate kinase [Nitrospirota bacterium]
MEELIRKAGVLIEALPYIRSFYGKTFVIKYGGSAQVEEHLKQAFAQDVALLNFIGIRPVVVHGGGPTISATMEKMGKKPSFVHGHRVTDEETMEIVEMYLGGLVNKQIVSLINSQGGRAVGLSGKDAGLIKARKKRLKGPAPEEYLDLGLVGEVTEVDPDVLVSLDRAGFIPVISPVGVGADGETLNINGDDLTAAVSAAVKAEKLIYLTDVPGIRDAGGKTLVSLSRAKAAKFVTAGTISGGMIPKVQAALSALKDGVGKVHIIDGRVPHCLLLEIFTDRGLGTEITH